jgi:hypothetical protein
MILPITEMMEWQCHKIHAEFWNRMAFGLSNDMHGYETETILDAYIGKSMVNAFVGFDWRYRKLDIMK